MDYLCFQYMIKSQYIIYTNLMKINSSFQFISGISAGLILTNVATDPILGKFSFLIVFMIFMMMGGYDYLMNLISRN